MKFATFFTALVASATAADNQAPVISLNLVGATNTNPATTTGAEFAAHTYAYTTANGGVSLDGGHPAGEVNTYADTCEVSANDPTSCSAPSAEAWDHHDGLVTVTKTYKTILSSAAGTYHENDTGAENTPTECASNQENTCLDNFAVRAEYVILYDAKDAEDNDAETVTFALIVLDSESPYCDPAAVNETPYCKTGAATGLTWVTLGDTCSSIQTNANMDYVDSCSQTVELCDVLNWAESSADVTGDIEWSALANEGYFDDYEGSVTAVGALYSSDQFAESDKIVSSRYNIPNAEFQDIDADKDIYYEYEVQDYAGVFGRNNLNNIFRERGTLTMTDTKKPIITSIVAPVTAECGYTAPATAVSASYNDCYDGWNTSRTGATESLTDVQIHDKSGVEADGFTGSGTAWETRKTWLVGAVTETLGVSTGYDRASNNPNTRSMVDGSFESSLYSDFTLYFNVKDHFGNAANEDSEDIMVVDSLAPTLYITDLTADDGHVINPDHTCLGGTAGNGSDVWQAAGDATASVGEDISEKGCTTAETDGIATFHSHDSATEHEEHAHATSPTTTFSDLLDEVTIQHSAGYDADYTTMSDLLVDGTGYRCSDGCWATVSSTVQWVDGSCAGAAGNNFDMKTVGTYYLHYSCVDGSGWTTTACRTVINVDKTKPIITVLQQANDASGHFILEATRDSDYVDEGATCSDIVDENLSSSVKVSGDLVDMAAPGTYTIKYNCKDSAENEALEAYRTVEVVDRTCPSCLMPQSEAQTTLTVEASFPYTDAEVDCTDNIDGAINGEYATSGAPTGTSYHGDLTGIDVETVKSDGYVVTYYAVDVAGNSYSNCYENPPAEGPITDETSQDTRIYRTVVVEDSLIPTVEITYDDTVLNDRGAHPETIMDENVDYMAENRLSANGWVIGAVASAVSGVALLGYAATRKATVATSVPV